MQTAAFWKKHQDETVQCVLCPHNCLIPDGGRGSCKVRANVKGSLFSLIFAETTGVGLDPIEKKPLYHFYPGSKILSLGTNGCNLACSFCQNWQISQTGNSQRQKLPSGAAVKLARKESSIGIAYTYNEPFIWFEYVLETARKAREAGLRNVLVTNGYVNPEPLLELLPYIDAMNIDLKSINDGFYKKTCNGSLAPVERTIETAQKHCHIELTNLLIPGKNDSEKDLVELAAYVAKLGKDIPLHFSRYFPLYKATEPATPASTLQNAARIARSRLNYVYIGNLEDEESVTNCPKCGAELVRRRGFSIEAYNLSASRCFNCGCNIYGSFKQAPDG